ncbi:MAG: hypothetical protein PF549_03220 [Patescibacteria group bacterium]|jgi:hypothetical protein|nr:hypothetical protein [Patescibacteria group bacterium]
MLINRNNEKVKVGAGWKLVIKLDDRTGTLFDRKGTQTRFQGDDKFCLPIFLKTESNSIDFVKIIAWTHGLIIKEVKKRNNESIEFIFGD